jgi:MYXO-CTERM domain-containing protein
MLDGTSAALLIDSTLLTVDDGLRATRATLGVEPGDDIAYVVFTASTSTGGEKIVMTALDPSLDDRDGSSADPAVIRLSDTEVSTGNPQSGWRAFSRYGSDRRMHVIYMDFDEATCLGAGAGGPFTIINAHITTAGKILVRETLTANGASSSACDPEARMAAGGNRIVWVEDIVTAQEVFSDTFSRADSGSSGFTCSMGPQGSAWRAGDLWLLLAGVFALGVRRRRIAA